MSRDCRAIEAGVIRQRLRTVQRDVHRFRLGRARTTRSLTSALHGQGRDACVSTGIRSMPRSIVGWDAD